MSQHCALIIFEGAFTDWRTNKKDGETRKQCICVKHWQAGNIPKNFHCFCISDIIRWLKHDCPMFLECQKCPSGYIWSTFFMWLEWRSSLRSSTFLYLCCHPAPQLTSPFPQFVENSLHFTVILASSVWKAAVKWVISDFFQMWRCFWLIRKIEYNIQPQMWIVSDVICTL